jgi:hypothetical protein
MRYAIIETAEDGMQNVYGPFRTEAAAERYIGALEASEEREADWQVTILVTPRT